MSEQLYERIFEETTAGVAVHEGENARFETVNPAYAERLGYERGALEGESLVALAGEGTGVLRGAVRRALDGEAELVEVSLTTAGGTERRVTLVLDRITVDGQYRLLSTLRNMADQETKKAKSISEQRLEVALAGTDTGVWEWDMETDEVVWTESMEQLFGLDPGTFEGSFEGFEKRVYPDDRPELEMAIETAVERDEPFRSEYRIRRDDGETRWVAARGELQRTADGDSRIVGIVTDITDRKHNKEALRQQEKQYRKLVERLPQAHYTIDSDWRVTFCNDAFAERLDTTVEAVEGERLWNLLPEAKGTVVERVGERVMETGEPEQFEYRYESGERWVSIQAYPYDGGVAAVSTDITDQQEALASVLDAAPVVIYRFDSDGIFQNARGEMLSRLGLEPEDLVGESVFEMYADHEAVLEAAERALTGESFRYTVTLGNITLETHYRPVYEDGEVAGVIGVSMDITELQRQRERMEFFNSILRHDVLNGMTVIKMRAELLAAELEGEHAQYAQTIVDWCDTTTEVTKRVRRVVETLATRDEEHALAPVDVSAILDRKHRELSNAYPAVTIETSVPAGVRVQADELLADVLGNVLTNSIEHNEAEGLRIEVALTREGDTVRIEIADNGQGIADDRKETVFRRGETSHAKETGSGFGLFFVDVMVEKYGGTVHIEDSDAGGARFVIELAGANAEADSE